MEKDIQIGAEDVLKMSISNGIVRIENVYAGKQAKAGAYVELTVEAYLEMLKKAIPGNVDDVVIDGLESAMKFIPA